VGLLALACERESDPPAGDASSPSGGPAEAAAEAESGARTLALPADWAEQHPTLSPNAQIEVHLASLEERMRPDHPADRAGRFWLESVTTPAPPGASEAAASAPPVPASGETPSLRAGSRHRFAFGFEVGPPGIAPGGAIFLLVDPFWYWSESQSGDPDAPGFTTARLQGPENGARLVPAGLPGGFRVEGRGLAAGERIELVYGAGAAGAAVDRYAERGAEIRVGLDADADGQRAWLPDPVAVDVVANAPAELVVIGPAEVEPGAAFELNLALVDAVGNRASWPAATFDESGRSRARFTIESLPAATQAPASGLGTQTSLAASDAPHRARLTAPSAEGTLRLRLRGAGPLEAFQADPPPIVVRRAATRLVWADLHGHTRYSDGTGSPDDYFRYAREVARLDAIALTDHDHWGIDAFDESPARQAEVLALAKRHNAPGVFVTLPGYEWTSWLHGHRHVLSFDDTLTVHSSVDPATDRPDELWQALRGKPVLTFAHHSAGDPVATNWHYAPDPELEPVTEIASVHGMSEALDAPAPIGGAIPGNFVRDVLLHGARLGFIGSGDSHDGHPGLAELASGQSGLAGLFVEALDRPGLHAALRARRSFATNGIRPWLAVSIDGVGMGGTLVAGARGAAASGGAASGEHVLRIRYEATAPIERVELVRTGRLARLELPGAKSAGGAADAAPTKHLSLDLERRIPELGPGEFHYVRIVQQDGGVAWSSPIFVDGERDGRGEHVERGEPGERGERGARAGETTANTRGDAPGEEG